MRPNWYLIRINSLLAALVLVLSSAIDWDQFISNYNLKRSKLLASLDKKYLISLSEGNIKQLYHLRNKSGFEIDSIYHYHSGQYDNGPGLDRKLYNFLQHNENGDWRSHNFRRERIKKDIQDMSASGYLDSLNLSETYPSCFLPLKDLPRLSEITSPDYFQIKPEHIKELKQLPRLEILHLYDISEQQIEILACLSQLKILYFNTKKKKTLEILKSSIPGLIIR